MAGLVLAGIILLVLGRYYHNLLLRAAGYAGYTQRGYERFLARKPSYKELLAGIRRQPALLGTQARFLAAQVKHDRPNIDTAFLENSETVLLQLLEDYENDDIAHPDLLTISEFFLKVMKLVESGRCSPVVERSLAAWVLNATEWTQVVSSLLRGFKKCQEAEVRKVRG